MDKQRLQGIFDLYQEIVKSNQQIYGIDALQQIVTLRHEFQTNELFSFRGLVREKELEAFVTLCYQLGEKLDFNNVTIDDVQKVLRTVRLQAAPASNLVSRVGVLKRDPGMFSTWTDSTVVVTKDKFMHIYPWKDPAAPQKLLEQKGVGLFSNKNEGMTTLEGAAGQSTDKKKQKPKSIAFDWSRPVASINIANIKSIDFKKDNKIEITQNKPAKARHSIQKQAQSHGLSKEAGAALNNILAGGGSGGKFHEKLVLKGADDSTFHEWRDFLTRSTNKEAKNNT